MVKRPRIVRAALKPNHVRHRYVPCGVCPLSPEVESSSIEPPIPGGGVDLGDPVVFCGGDGIGSPVTVSVVAVLTSCDSERGSTVPGVGTDQFLNATSSSRCVIGLNRALWLLNISWHVGHRRWCRYRRRRCARLGWSIYSPLSPTTIAASIIIHRDSVSIWESVIVISEHRWSPNHRHRKQQPSGYDEPYPDTSLLCRSVRGESLTSIPITQSFLSLLGTESVHPPSMLSTFCVPGHRHDISACQHQCVYSSHYKDGPAGSESFLHSQQPVYSRAGCSHGSWWVQCEPDRRNVGEGNYLHFHRCYRLHDRDDRIEGQ